mgnify:CR=1 FL=1
MDILKIALTAVVSVLLYVLIKQLKPEYAPLTALAAAGIILVSITENLLDATGTLEKMLVLSGLEKKNISLLIKSLGICIVTQFASDLCRENSASSIATAVELAGRLGMLMLSLPMIETVARIAIGLING